MKNIDRFKVIGIAARTTNKNGKSAEDLAKLWSQFYVDDIPGKVTNKTSNDIYSIYTDYESDYTGKYTTIIGFKVHSFDQVPDGLVGREFEGGHYQHFVATGQMPHAVAEIWREIWQQDGELNRKYTADFEVYGQKSQNGDHSEVDIFIATK